jgi:hypothetical protein
MLNAFVAVMLVPDCPETNPRARLRYVEPIVMLVLDVIVTLRDVLELVKVAVVPESAVVIAVASAVSSVERVYAPSATVAVYVVAIRVCCNVLYGLRMLYIVTGISAERRETRRGFLMGLWKFQTKEELVPLVLSSDSMAMKDDVIISKLNSESLCLRSTY